jgi:integrase
MALKHLTRIRDKYINDDGLEVAPLSLFGRYLDQRGYSGASKKRDLYAAVRFLDYLIECRVFGVVASPARISDAMAFYPLFLRDGVKMDCPEFPDLPHYAMEIGAKHGLSENGFGPALAAVNSFLRLAREEALKLITVLFDAGAAVDLLDLSVTFSSIEGVVSWSREEKERFRQQAMIGGVVRIKGELTRPRGLRAPLRGGAQITIEHKEFPLPYLGALLAEARTSRDKALWALLAGGGLRIHEALLIRLSDVNFETGEIFVIDPDSRRFRDTTEDKDKIRFKGRKTARVYLYEPLRTFFWEALRDYLQKEFISSGLGASDYLFKKVDTVARGLPLMDASDTAVEKQFKAAVRRAKVPGPPEAPDHVWTLHSLRHSYGVYMLNYIPVPGGPGLRLTQVQMLMGHASTESTRVYARHDRLIIEAKVEAADNIIFNGSSPPEEALTSLPLAIAARLRKEAEEIEQAVSAARTSLTSQSTH